MLWADVVDESTPERLFFSRAFEWSMRLHEKRGFGDDFYKSCNSEVYTENNQDLATKYSRYYRLYTRESRFYAQYSSSDETMKLFDSLLLDMADVYYPALKRHQKGIDPFSFLMVIENGKPYNGIFPTYRQFREQIFNLNHDDIIKWFNRIGLHADSAPKKGDAIIKNDIHGGYNVFHEKTPLYKIRDGLSEKEQKEILREAEHFYKNIYDKNKAICQTVLSELGFPYGNSISDYKSFLSKCCPTFEFQTKLGQAKIKTLDLLTMELPLQIFRNQY